VKDAQRWRCPEPTLLPVITPPVGCQGSAASFSTANIRLMSADSGLVSMDKRLMSTDKRLRSDGSKLLANQPRGLELDYCAIAVKKAGNGFVDLSRCPVGVPLMTPHDPQPSRLPPLGVA